MHGEGSVGQRGLWHLVVLVAFGVVALSVACGSSPVQPTEQAVDLPSFAYSSAATLDGYRYAAQNADTLAAIPCYCGCGKSLKHTDLRRCFINADGSYDDHASGCDVCVKEALDVKEMRQQGKQIKQVRAAIDQKYAQYGDPTDTPLPK